MGSSLHWAGPLAAEHELSSCGAGSRVRGLKSCIAACGILVPQTVTGDLTPCSLHCKVGLNHWDTRVVPEKLLSLCLGSYGTLYCGTVIGYYVADRPYNGFSVKGYVKYLSFSSVEHSPWCTVKFNRCFMKINTK